MPCSQEALERFFYNVSSSCFLLFLFLYSSSILLRKLFHFIGSYPLIQRNQDRYDDYNFFSEEEEEEEEEYTNGSYYHVNCPDESHLVADIVHGGESLVFCSNDSLHSNQRNQLDEFMHHYDPISEQDGNYSAEQFSAHDSPCSESERDDDHDEDADISEEKMPTRRDTDPSVPSSDRRHGCPLSPIAKDLQTNVLVDNDDETCDEDGNNQDTKNKKVETDFSKDESFLVFAPSQLESKKFIVQEKEEEEEIYGDSCTVGSTSKSSSEWRSSINCRDSGTDDPFSSSSRRSCPKWESYTVFQKYDEEMMFLDRISAQKLHETDSLRSIQACPRSISERIVHKLTTIKKRPSDIRHNPYRELETAYVAQICLTWEALNWNYKNFESKRASRRDFDPGCPASVAQQFQQFQVLLQRYVENEPYEQGRRPEIYARMRLLAPKLLLVPEYRDSDDDQKEEGFGSSRISSAAFLMIMEDCIRTFMNFLKADKEKPCEILKSFFGRTKRSSVDPTLLQLMKKVNAKKKMKLKDLRRVHKCMRKRKLTIEEEMEILMGLIDLKVVSRVLRMTDMSEEQLHWCEEKMSKVRVMEGKLQRDSSPLFFPAH